MVAGALAGSLSRGGQLPLRLVDPADLAAGAARIGGGMAIGMILTVIITLYRHSPARSHEPHCPLRAPVEADKRRVVSISVIIEPSPGP